MEFALKQRLVGAAVIIALAVVFIPMLLKGTGNQTIREIPPRPDLSKPIGQSLDIDKTIPLPPEKSSTLAMPAMSEESRNGVIKEVAKESKDTVEKVVKKSKSVQKAMAPIQKQASGTAMQVTKKSQITTPSLEAWVVQIASFSVKDKAKALRDKLKKQGFNVFMEGSVTKDKKTMYRVRIGPEPERKKAEMLLKQLQEKTKLQGLVISYP